MREITVPLPGRSYPIRIGAGILTDLGAQCRRVGLDGSLAVVCDSAVAGAYLPKTLASLKAAGYRAVSIIVPSGEGSKCLAQLGELYDAFAQAGLDRGSAVVALGGGVVGDLAGFAAATLLRGLPVALVPTTLLAQVDAAIGGKTAIDLPAGKNLAGTFHQPSLVLIDLNTLDTLPERELRAGMAEVIKYGVIDDPELLSYVESNREAILAHQPEEMTHVIARCCEIKAAVVGEDERESGKRAILNFGHTIGHAIEAVAGYGHYLHGEAVAIGMAAAGRLSRLHGGWSDTEEARVNHALTVYGLPTRLEAPLPEEALLAAMRLDKKTRDGEFRFVLAKRLGEVSTIPVSEAEAREALKVIAPAGGYT
jgi:3-dehydroquinate synthase